MSIDTPDRTATRTHTIKPVRRTTDGAAGGAGSARAGAGHAIGAEDLERAAEGIEINPGDVILIR